MQTPVFYVEREIRTHPRTREVLEKFPRSRVLPIDRYSEVFNRKNQNFRRQKEQGKVFLLAKKVKNFVLPLPFDYVAQTKHNFYFSHLYNCPYDCEYCYLQGMYRSAYFVLFVNYEDFGREIRKVIEEVKAQKSKGKNNGEKIVTFFSGYDCDSLALEHVTGFARYFIPQFEKFSHADLDLRTKSANIASLLELPAPKNTFVTWTLSPEEVCDQWEKRAAPLQARVQALKELQKRGWRVTIRLEPVIAFAGWERSYASFFDYLEREIDFGKVEGLGWGLFRLPKEMLKKMRKMLPGSTLLSKYYELRTSGEMTYSKDLEEKVTDFLLKRCGKLLPREKVFYAGKEK